MSRILAYCLVSLLVACGSASNSNGSVEEFSDQPFYQWRMPDRLREISGLALTTDERLLAITDEIAIVYEIDFESGEIVKEFAMGSPPLRGDFEGIAVIGDAVWLMTSDGILYKTVEGGDRENVSYEEYDTGLGDYCELEGLGQDQGQQMLFLACKEPHAKKDALKVFALTAGATPPTLNAAIDIDRNAIEGKLEREKIRPSAITLDTKSGNLLMVAARQKALITLSPDGRLIDAIILPGKGRHRQAEGIEVTGAGRLLIADEGGDGQARLAVYRWAETGLEPKQ